MSTTVQVKNSRLIIKKDGRLVSDKGGNFLDADTNNRFIVVLLKSGRVQLLRLDGRFITDLPGRSDGTRVKIASDDTVTWSNHGREEKCNVKSHYKSSIVRNNVKSFKDANNAEEFGGVLADWLIDNAKILVAKIHQALKNKP
jgi:hypothetical protein